MSLALLSQSRSGGQLKKTSRETNSFVTRGRFLHIPDVVCASRKLFLVEQVEVINFPRFDPKL